jgi:MIP family channel proteins
MPFSFDDSLIVPLILGILACNVLCVAVLLCLRPAAQKAALRRETSAFAQPFRSCLAEAIGTFALVFFSILALTGGIIAGPAGQQPSLLVGALAAGLTVAVLNAALGAVSGGHFNPAVTLGFVASGRLHPVVGVLYWLGQLGGAAAAAGLLLLLFGPETIQASTPAPAEMVSLPAAVVLEAIATFFLVLVFFGTTVDKRGPKLLAPLAIGLTVVVAVLALGPFTGAALNPARYFGPALVLQNPGSWVLYLAGPCLGGCLAAVLMQFVFCEEENASESLEEPDVLQLLPRRTRRSA